MTQPSQPVLVDEMKIYNPSTLHRIYRHGGHTIRVVTAWDHQRPARSTATVEVLNAEYTWTQLAYEPAENWARIVEFDETTAITEQVQADLLRRGTAILGL